MPSPFRALLDANVIYSNHLRNLLLQLAANDAFEAHWTAEIECEWLRNTDEATRDRIERYTLPLIRHHFPDVIVDGFDQGLETGKTDAKDRHVAAAARYIAPCYLVTENLKHFDAEALQRQKVTVRSADGFLTDLSDAKPAFMYDAVNESRLNLRPTKPSFEEYLDLLAARCGLKNFVAQLKRLPNPGPLADYDET